MWRERQSAEWGNADYVFTNRYCKKLDDCDTDYTRFIGHIEKIHELKCSFSNAIGDLYPNAECNRIGL